LGVCSLPSLVTEPQGPKYACSVHRHFAASCLGQNEILSTGTFFFLPFPPPPPTPDSPPLSFPILAPPVRHTGRPTPFHLGFPSRFLFPHVLNFLPPRPPAATYPRTAPCPCLQKGLSPFLRTLASIIASFFRPSFRFLYSSF